MLMKADCIESTADNFFLSRNGSTHFAANAMLVFDKVQIGIGKVFGVVSGSSRAAQFTNWLAS